MSTSSSTRNDEGVDRIEIQVVPRFKTSGTPGYGFGFKDLLCDAAGAVAVELVVAIGKKVF